ncbi:hypothetical protein KDX31_03765 [Amphritea atlantica]|uniref:Uncharacterized protein n=1 Tax=Amphritea atlantica TaxID=355243 RepID=A0ABY5GXY7_9GAMM|nr:hypothetical protein KDX31_03765 [Amphritea atlantica]
MKRSIKYALWFVLIFGAGAYTGGQIATAYYKPLNLTNLIGYQTHQASSYAVLFGGNEDVKAKELIFSDLKLNLLKANIHQEKLPSTMKEHLCSQLLKVVEDRESIEAFAFGLPQSETEISELITDIGRCETW